MPRFNRILSRALAPIVIFTYFPGLLQAQTSVTDLTACITAGLPLYQYHESRYTRTEILQTFYSSFCAVSYDFTRLNKTQKEGVRAMWKGQYGDFAGDWSNNGTNDSEEVHYRQSCDTLHAMFQGSTVSISTINSIRGDQDRFIEACMVANAEGVRMRPQLPTSPSGLVVLSFSSDVVNKEITGVQTVNLECELDGEEINGALPTARVFSGNAAQIICERAHRPIVVVGSQGEYYPPADVVVTTNYAELSPKISLPEEVDGQLGTRMLTLEARMNPVGTIIALRGSAATCPTGWDVYADASGRFLRGSSQEYPAGVLSGQDTVKLEVPNMPRHNHGGSAGNFVSRSPDNGSFSGGDNGTSSNNAKINWEGNGTPFRIIPSFVSVTYCVKT